MSMWTAPSDLDYRGDDGYDPESNEMCIPECTSCRLPREVVTREEPETIPF
jgi:hypothetical protein